MYDRVDLLQFLLDREELLEIDPGIDTDLFRILLFYFLFHLLTV